MFLPKKFITPPSQNGRVTETHEVMVGDVGIGGNNPVRIQSMTTTDTMNTIATVEQSIRMIEAGYELVNYCPKS
ncbi:MAG: flavodoxin-dependent (E)-4-hydroxy-3-methylbut-2-enyl-diphosphate synthase [Ignavibacteriales bacterium]|nr:flavodoxin-dependent (E)-4-hydroxy-3-methylbut-2-enyl-diphosphate synthase [Ignavibacteriales bacterium]